MNRRDIVIGGIILVVLAGVVYLRQRNAADEFTVPQTLSVEDKIEEAFNLEIPEDVDKAELTDKTGGTSSAIATRKYEDNRYELSILADLPEVSSGKFYQGWIKGEDDKLVSAGKLRVAKGGWMIDYSSSSDYSNFNGVSVSLEEVFDNTPEEIVLEGSF